LQLKSKEMMINATKNSIQMKNILLFCLGLVLLSCGSDQKVEKEVVDAKTKLEKDLAMYTDVWNRYIAGDSTVLSETYFDPNITVVTANGDVVGIEAIQAFYKNYLVGFSEIEFEILDAFGQGDRIVKHWHFKGKHTGEFFGIPASGNYMDLSGTTMVTMKDGRILQEQDYFDLQSMMDQLSKSDEDMVIDVYQPDNL
tara:strand:+ start:2374 stop:2967 length:594 start_codon:yes stop_codon:yes gene_type:complete